MKEETFNKFKKSAMEVLIERSNFYVGNRIRDNLTHRLKTIVEVQEDCNRIIFDDGTEKSISDCILETCLVPVKRYDVIGG